MADYTAKRIDDCDAALGGAFKRVRAELGVTSFGMQVIDLPPDFEHYPEHDHVESGQEEVFLVLDGSGHLDIDGERVELDRQTVVRVGPAARRRFYSGPEGARLLALGGTPGQPFGINPVSEIGGPAPMVSPS